jgi:hypothetical protein
VEPGRPQILTKNLSFKSTWFFKTKIVKAYMQAEPEMEYTKAVREVA